MSEKRGGRWFRRSMWLSLLSAALCACGGGGGGAGGGSSPTAPASAATTGDGSGQHMAVAGQIAIVTVSGLGEGSVSSLQAASSSTLAAASVRASSSVRYECPLGGEVLFDQLPPAIGSDAGPIGVVGVTEEWVECSWENAGVRYTANGHLTLSGTYVVSGDQSIGVTGSLTTDPLGTTAVDGTVTGETSFIGTVGDRHLECIGCVIVPPNPCSDFDGSYQGEYRGTYDGDNVYGGVRFSVSNCQIAVTVPGSGSGTVDNVGQGSFNGGLDAGVACRFSGRFYEGGVAGGDWQCAGASESGAGLWRARR